MTQVNFIPHPKVVYQKLMDLLISLAEHGLVHGDFNEFNLMIDDDEQITMIDFPQMLSTSHENGVFYFERDVKCIQTYFSKNYGMVFSGMPTLDVDITRKEDLDKEVRASGFVQQALKNQDASAAFEQVTDMHANINNDGPNEGEEESSEDEENSDGEEEYKN